MANGLGSCPEWLTSTFGWLAVPTPARVLLRPMARLALLRQRLAPLLHIIESAKTLLLVHYCVLSQHNSKSALAQI